MSAVCSIREKNHPNHSIFTNGLKISQVLQIGKNRREHYFKILQKHEKVEFKMAVNNMKKLRLLFYLSKLPSKQCPIVNFTTVDSGKYATSEQEL